MTEKQSQATREATRRSTWGPKLFAAVLVAALVFFWWLLIYSHGVTPHNG